VLSLCAGSTRNGVACHLQSLLILDVLIMPPPITNNSWGCTATASCPPLASMCLLLGQHLPLPPWVIVVLHLAKEIELYKKLHGEEIQEHL
jgi:hypothetical protein